MKFVDWRVVVKDRCLGGMSYCIPKKQKGGHSSGGVGTIMQQAREGSRSHCRKQSPHALGILDDLSRIQITLSE